MPSTTPAPIALSREELIAMAREADPFGDVELLPLPEATMKSYQTDSTMRTMALYSYSASEMRDYARANIAQLQAENERLLAERDTLREALGKVCKTFLPDCRDGTIAT